MIASEYYNVAGVQGWYTDRTGLAAIGVCPECPIAPGEVERGDGYVAVKMADIWLSTASAATSLQIASSRSSKTF